MKQIALYISGSELYNCNLVERHRADRERSLSCCCALDNVQAFISPIARALSLRCDATFDRASNTWLSRGGSTTRWRLSAPVSPMLTRWWALSCSISDVRSPCIGLFGGFVCVCVWIGRSNIVYTVTLEFSFIYLLHLLIFPNPSTAWHFFLIVPALAVAVLMPEGRPSRNSRAAVLVVALRTPWCETDIPRLCLGELFAHCDYSVLSMSSDSHVCAFYYISRLATYESSNNSLLKCCCNCNLFLSNCGAIFMMRGLALADFAPESFLFQFSQFCDTRRLHGSIY